MLRSAELDGVTDVQDLPNSTEFRENQSLQSDIELVQQSALTRHRNHISQHVIITSMRV